MVVQDYSIKHVFVDRERELTKLKELLGKIQSGTGQIVIITGEHGIGKTRLVEEFKRFVEHEQNEQFQFFSGRCKRTGGKDPYQPFIEALNYQIPKSSAHGYQDSNLEDNMEQSNIIEEKNKTKEDDFKLNNNSTSDTLYPGDAYIKVKPLGLIPFGEPEEEEAPVTDEDIEPISPEIPKLPVGEPLPMGLIPAAFRTTEVNDFKKQRTYLFEVMTEHLFRLSMDSPVILFIDDTHWVNLASLGYLQYLTERIIDRPIMLIFTLSTDELNEDNEKNQKIRELFKNLESFDYYNSLTLERFNINNVGTMIKKIFSREDVPEGFIKQIYEKTEGNPLFIEDTIRALIEADVIDVSSYVWQTRIDVSQIRIPDSTREVLISRFGKLDKKVLKVLSYAAVIGREFTFDLLTKLTEISKEELLDYIDILLENKLIHEDLSSDEDQYTFDNPLILDIAYSQLSRSRRRYLHTNIGNIVEQKNINDVGKAVFDIANHFSKGWEFDKALKYLILAGDSAIQIYAIDDARRYYLSALELLNKFDYTLEIQQREIELLSNLGYTCQMLGDWDQGLEYYQTIPKLIENLQNKLKDREHSDSDQAISEGTDTELIPINWIQLKLADTYWNIAELMRFKSGWVKAERFYKKSLTISQEIDDYHGIAQAERGRGYISWRQGQSKKALDHYDICIDFATKINDLPVIAVTYIDIANIHNYLGEWEQAIAYYTESIEHLGKIGWLHETGRAYNGLGEIFTKQEKWESAIENFKKSEEISKKIGDPYKRGWALFNAAECYAKMQELDKAMENCKLAEEILTRLDDRAGLAMVHKNFGIIYHYKKEWSKADEHFNKSIELLKGLKLPYESGYAYLEYGLMLRNQGNNTEAQKCLVFSLEIFKSMDAKREIAQLEDIIKQNNSGSQQNQTTGFNQKVKDQELKDQKVAP